MSEHSTGGYRTADVAVRGGALRCGLWGPEDPAAPVLLAVHGVTASHKTWGLVAARLPQLRIIAPDLRGRGRSNDLPGPYGMAAHAEDLAGVLRAFEVESAVVAGHSMGAFVSVVLAHRYPQLVRSLILIDGGLPLQVPAGLSDDEVIEAVLGPAAERLGTRYASREAYRSFWKQHPAFARNWNPLVEEYVDYDLAGEEPGLRPATRFEAMRDDTADLNRGPELRAALAALAVPALLLRAPRGLMDEPAGLYTEAHARRWEEALDRLTVWNVQDVNHYTIVMDAPGAGVVAGAVAAALKALPEPPALPGEPPAAASPATPPMTAAPSVSTGASVPSLDIG
jgi:lipase